jgi:predicted Zn-dependent protease
MMALLAPPDTHYLQAAEGWLELGNLVEAQAELNQITPRFRGHPAVLEVRWRLYARNKQWDLALRIASALVRTVPEHPLGWIHRSFCLHEMARTAEARDNLLRVVNRFRVSATVRYNLARYECRLGRIDQARQWLKSALLLGNARKMKRAALDDPDLQPLWKELHRV